jgi:phosphoserine phosphatase RsbU/P
MSYNILIADDYDINRNLIKVILKNKIKAVNFFEAENGLEVMKIISFTDIDLIILDLVMPEKDGFEVLQEIKGSSKHKKIPIIVNSSLEDMDSVQRALENGALDYFTKPLNNNEINITLPLKVKNALEYYEQTKLLVGLNNQMKTELEFAKLFQTSLMAESKIVDIAEMYGRYLPCNKIGGDLYDYIQVEDKLWFIIADVCGHGVVSAMLSSMIKVIFNNFIQYLPSPKEVLENLNTIFCNILGEDNNLFFSAFVGLLQGNRLSYSNAGHYYPMVIDANAESLKILEQKGLFIGIIRDTIYENSVDILKAGDCIVAFTDGLFDTGSTEYMKDWDKVYEGSLEIAELLKKDPEKFIDVLIKSVNGEDQGEFRDDVTVMIIKIK